MLPRDTSLGWLLALAACSGPADAVRLPGDDDLGGFRVQASEVSNGCGAGALGSQPRFEFEIDLSRDLGTLFWGRSASGWLGASLEFEFAAAVRVAVSKASPQGEGCVIGRTDNIAGSLEADARGEVLGFSARMRHGFAQDSGSECSLDERIGAGLPRLPCEMEYTLVAERVREPIF